MRNDRVTCPVAVEEAASSLGHWTIRLYEACAVVWLTAKLNALWLGFTPLGGRDDASRNGARHDHLPRRSTVPQRHIGPTFGRRTLVEGSPSALGLGLAGCGDDEGGSADADDLATLKLMLPLFESVPDTDGTMQQALEELAGVRLLVLDETSANRLYHLDFAGRERPVLSDTPVHIEHGELVAHPERGRFTVAVLPAPAQLQGTGSDLASGSDEGLWRTWSFTAIGSGTAPLLSELRPEPGQAPEPRTGGPIGRLSTPADFSTAGRVHIDVPLEHLATDRPLLRIEWTGDVGRAFAGDRLIGDHFWHGPVWDVDLTPHRDAVAEHGVRLELLPWRRATGVWVDQSVRDVDDGITLQAASLIKVGKVHLTVESGDAGPEYDFV